LNQFQEAKDKSVFTVTKDGIYYFQIEVNSADKFNASFTLKFQNGEDFLTGKDLKLLHVSS